ncbi:MAG: hypothetical protein ACRDBG_26680 [Waterburya sp.]
MCKTEFDAYNNYWLVTDGDRIIAEGFDTKQTAISASRILERYGVIGFSIPSYVRNQINDLIG